MLIEKMISVELKRAINMFSSVVPNIKMLISPVLDVAYTLQEKYGDVGMKMTCTGLGSWSSNLCVNATTGVFHNEDDCTYTIICVHFQLQSINKYGFLFKMDDSNTIGIELKSNTSILFSGLLLTHRQGTDDVVRNKEGSDIFLNISSYGNKHLFSRIRKSFERK